ncbi:iron complex transport system ATP-binding protein [Kroppenstedtia sanguinis]|uniref:ABC transporter ATP-binding protein n=1 Tax=Kroppenstedtia sanguinis TaxID=1380684 RepID=UPI003D1E23E8
MSLLSAKGLVQRFQNKTVIADLNMTIAKGKIYSIIGPNGSGKSTLLKMLVRQLKPKSGEVLLGGMNVYEISPKKVARAMSFLTQGAEEVDVAVKQLVSYGRSPHKSFLQKMNADDEQIIGWAMEQTNIQHLAEQNVSLLSGGERQRVWIAMALAQQPQILFLDEPTTYLDLSHQLEVMEVVKKLNREHGVSVLMVLHDMNHAAAYSDEILVMDQGRLYAKGPPHEVMTPRMLNEVFHVDAQIYTDPEDGEFRLIIKRSSSKRKEGVPSK